MKNSHITAVMVSAFLVCACQSPETSGSAAATVDASASSQGQGGIEQQIREVIEAAYEHSRVENRDPEGYMSREGSLEFWSNGGLLNEIPSDSPPTEYSSFDIVAKNIRVVPLSDTMAIAFYYGEGSVEAVGAPAVPHYLARIMEVYVKEGEAWKVRAAHASPLTGGSGWTLTTPNDGSR